MQGPTHLVTGILIQKSLTKVRPMPLQYSAVAALAVLSHGILDHLAEATYHPPTPLAHDWFWVMSHLTVAVLTLCIIVRYWRGYKFSMSCSVLPDLDWLVRPVANFFSMGFGQKPPLHTLLNRFIDLVIPPKIWDLLPNWNLARRGLIVEVILFAILLACIHALGKRPQGVDIKRELSTSDRNADSTVAVRRHVENSHWTVPLACLIARRNQGQVQGDDPLERAPSPANSRERAALTAGPN